MDYIQEELRRQREALAGLLLGAVLPQGAEDGGDSGPAAVPRTAALTAVPAAGAAFVPAREVRGRPAEEGAFFAVPGAFSAGSGGSAVLGIPEIGGRVETTGFGEAEESAGEGERAAPADCRRRSGASGRLPEAVPPGLAGTGWAAEVSSPLEARRTAGGAVLERTVTEFIQAEGGGNAAGAEALSRAFQRDARRYDGGFSLY